MAAAASGKVRSRRSRKQQSANAVTDNKTISKHRRRSESSSRRLWMMAESVLARTKALEQLDQDCSPGERPHSVPPPHMSIPPKEDANRSLYKILEAALTRISVLEKRRDICYCCAFKAPTGDECIIRGCGSVVSTQHTVRHLRTTSTPQHQVAAMILQQTECLECNKSWKIPSGLVHHERKFHGNVYTSRMEIFRPIFHQTSCSVDGKSHDIIPSPSFPPNITDPPPADSASANPTSPPDSEVHHLPRTPVYCPQPDVNAFTTPVSANPAPQPAPISLAQHPTYFLQPEWSEPNAFQSFADPTSVGFSQQQPPPAPVSCPQPDWSKSNDFNPWTPPSRPEPGSLPQHSTGRQHPDWSWHTTPSQVQ
ncbi:hypothetical protein ABVK25_002982 [Lepraria finkii]|uniref:C2H2-type domain-containing protein n=1 Tax=Lepraria finkii TaxID=1340010 RepID=A0ABR4BKV6_9LECA